MYNRFYEASHGRNCGQIIVVSLNHHIMADSLCKICWQTGLFHDFYLVNSMVCKTISVRSLIICFCTISNGVVGVCSRYSVEKKEQYAFQMLDELMISIPLLKIIPDLFFENRISKKLIHKKKKHCNESFSLVDKKTTQKLVKLLTHDTVLGDEQLFETKAASKACAIQPKIYLSTLKCDTQPMKAQSSSNQMQSQILNFDFHTKELSNTTITPSVCSQQLVFDITPFRQTLLTNSQQSSELSNLAFFVTPVLFPLRHCSSLWQFNILHLEPDHRVRPNICGILILNVDGDAPPLIFEVLLSQFQAQFNIAVIQWTPWTKFLTPRKPLEEAEPCHPSKPHCPLTLTILQDMKVKQLLRLKTRIQPSCSSSSFRLSNNLAVPVQSFAPRE
ncbi:hypothetical protein VP01_4112g1 [Puccinia sorghi]|uniref:Uncharacterized protein n=1 Tax=Puccinia sorghi TaxID=27349 RepID=A0A0L6UR89_9BASI|nr:hypothetical protein VP01_4112g1 [Puccinia sorghi]